MSIDLRFSNVNPPESDAVRTIYCDIVGLSNPMYLGLICRAFNDDSVGLYMQLVGTHPNWTFTTTNLGLLGADADNWYRINQFGYRTRPTSETTEILDITLNAYTDAGYTNLKWTITRSISIFMIKSDDGSWNLDEYDNFDDGTVQGWAADTEPDPPANIAVNTDFVLSPLYSLKADNNRPTSFTSTLWLYKSFTTADKDLVLGVANVRFDESLGTNPSFTSQILVDDEVVISLPSVTLDKWYRFVFLLPRDSTVQVKLYFSGSSGSHPWWMYQWLDDFKIISKDQELPAIDLSGTKGIGFYWWGAENPPEALNQLILETPTGFWFTDFYDGYASWRLLEIPWGEFTWVSREQRLLEPHHHGFDSPDKSGITGFIWTVHTSGIRRLDYVYAYSAGRPANLLGIFTARYSTSLTLSAEFLVRHFSSRDLPAEFIVQQAGSEDLPAQFEVRQGSEDLKCIFEIIPLLEFFGPWVAVASNPRAVEYPFQEKVYHYADRHWLFYVEDEFFRYIHSPDGENWSAPSNIISSGSNSRARMVSIWVDSGIVHFTICVSDGFPGNDLWYMRGTLAGDGSIAWDPRRTALGIGSAWKCKWPTICCDVNGYPYITFYAAREAAGQGGDQKVRIIKSDTKDGTWTMNPNYGWYTSILSSNDQIQYTAKPIPLDNGKVFTLYGGDARQTPWWPGMVYPFENEFLGRLADSSGMGAEASEAIGSTWDYHNSGSVINVGNDVIAAIVCADHALRICKWETATEDWGTPAVIQTGLPSETLIKFLRFPSGIVEPEMFAILWLDLATDEIRYKVSVDGGDTWRPGGNTSYIVLKQYGGGFIALDQWTSAYQASHIWGAIGFTFVNDSDELMYGYIRKANAMGVP